MEKEMNARIANPVLLFLAAAVAVLPGCSGSNGEKSAVINNEGQSTETMAPAGGDNMSDMSQANSAAEQGAYAMDGNTTNSTSMTDAAGNNSAQPR
ncbi:hypothetical protein [Sphingomonas quercus]|uniref:Lipoprotein n=1 Tax=Sphingomonas quercus TaxID=2842451 RepID=A0ABS6BJP0_9SPHN|nr:hypothetical protein [Sphingomonas quercus]MBU3077842.1 hypothetical protein [Sphingomonas quercus]